MADVKARLAAVLDHIVREELSHEQRAADMAASRTVEANHGAEPPTA